MVSPASGRPQLPTWQPVALIQWQHLNAPEVPANFVSSLVRYYKTGFDSPEGYAVLRTLSPAFMVSPYDSSPPMVTLEAIGRVFLCHVEFEPVGSTVGAKIKSIASGFIERLLQSVR